MKNDAIVLIAPPSRSNSQILPIPLICLAGYLEGKGKNVFIVDVKRDPFAPLGEDEIAKVTGQRIREASSRKPSLVGLPCFSADYRSVITIAGILRGQTGAKVVVGGVHPTLKPEDFIYPGSPIDFVVIGEGEETLNELADSLRTNSEIRHVKGLAFLEQDRLILTQPREMLDLSILPRPAYHKINMEYYLKVSRIIIRYLYISGVHIFTSRGCPFACTFCANRNIWKMQKQGAAIRYRPTGQVLDEIEFLKKNYGLDGFYLADDTFAINESRAITFCEELSSRGLNVVWAMETRVNLATDKLLDAAKKAGCIQVEFGVESGSQDALDRMKKGIRIEDTIRAFDLCRKKGLRTFANILINTPGETAADLKKTLWLKRRIRADRASVNMTVPFIGSDVYEQYVRPPLQKTEYYLFEHPQICSKIIDRRFRMAAHDINLDRLHYKISFMNYVNTSLEVTADPRYWKVILGSNRRWELLPVFLKNLRKQLKSYFRFFSTFLKDKSLRSKLFSARQTA